MKKVNQTNTVTINLQIGNVSLNTLRGDGGFGSTGV